MLKKTNLDVAFRSSITTEHHPDWGRPLQNRHVM